MAGYKGRDAVIKKGNAATTEVFTTIGGLRTTKLTINNNPADVSDDSSGFRQMLADAGIQAIDISGDGVTKSDATLAALEAAAFARTVSNYQIVFGNGDMFAGAFVISSFERTGPHNDAETYSISLMSSGTVTFTPGV